MLDLNIRVFIVCVMGYIYSQSEVLFVHFSEGDGSYCPSSHASYSSCRSDGNSSLLDEGGST